MKGIRTVALYLFLAMVFISFPFPSCAGEDGEGVGLEELIKDAVENNPEIRSARLKWAGVIQRYPQAVALDDPMLTYTYPVEGIETKVGPQEHTFSLTQRLPFPGKLKLRGEIVSKDAQIARLNYDRVVRDVIVKVKRSFYELYYIDMAISLTEQNKKVLEHMVKVATTDYAQDGTTLNDVVKAQSEYAQVSYDLLLLKEMRETELTRLNTLLNRPPEERFETFRQPAVKPFEHNLDELYRWALEGEEIRIKRLEVEKRDLETSLARYAYLPDFRIGVNYISIGEGDSVVRDSGKDSMGVVFGINIPIWFSKNRAIVKEAEFKKESTVREKRALENETLSTVKNLYLKLVNTNRLIELYSQSLIPQAQQSLEIAETWYRNKQGSLSGLLETQTILYNFQIAYFRAVADYLKTIADLERVTGRRLY